MAALMRRFGGHPYERGDMLDFKAVDPTKNAYENFLSLGYNNNELVGWGGRGQSGRALLSQRCNRLCLRLGGCGGGRAPTAAGTPWPAWVCWG